MLTHFVRDIRHATRKRYSSFGYTVLATLTLASIRVRRSFVGHIPFSRSVSLMRNEDETV